VTPLERAYPGLVQGFQPTPEFWEQTWEGRAARWSPVEGAEQDPTGLTLGPEDPP
jgi:hypothetical protein